MGAGAISGAFTVEKVSKYLVALLICKSPGKTGSPVNTTKDLLVPHVTLAFQEAEASSSMGAISNKATITLLPKAGKVPLECASCRPISLLVLDLKIMAKLLAMRLGNVIAFVIQLGFVLGSSTPDHPRELAHLMWWTKDDPSELLVLSLDAEMVFD